MVSHAGTGGVRPFLQLLEVQALRDAADPELLRRVAAADEAAFRVVAERHGPMVFGVCARLLGNRHDAEDALQATFLVLARRAGAVRKSESLASWLHGVARRVALRLRRADRRRAAREHAAAVPDGRTPPDALAWGEVRSGLDDELARLPAAYRDVLVLCYLEGLSRDEAGQRLGLDAGAVKGRLERGRRLLGERLVRRGIGLSAGLAALAVAPDAAAALRLGRLAADPAAATPRAAALSHDFLKGVAMSKFKLVTAGVAGVLVLAVGVGTAQPPKPPTPAGQVGLGKYGAAADKDTDEAFIRRVSRDLRGTDPTPAEVHFFLASKDANRRATLVDLFVKERTAKAAGQADKLVDLTRRSDADAAEAIRRYAETLQLARVREEQARAEAEKAAAERAVQAERAAREQARRALDEANAAEALVRQAQAERDAERARAQEALAREKAKAKGPTTAVPLPPRPTEKGFRTSNPTADPDRATEPKKTPGAPPPVTTGGSRNTVPAAPPSVSVPTALAANVEVLKVRVQLAELAVREKKIAMVQLEGQTKLGVVTPELLQAQLDIDRAQLMLREAQLTLEQAERGDQRPLPPANRP
ncbi:MAG: sigma-70 family RNA polymerase sigma factor [Gemmataceae bacterium]